MSTKLEYNFAKKMHLCAINVVFSDFGVYIILINVVLTHLHS